MGLNWQEGLGRLSEGLGTMAKYYAVLDERKWVEQRDAANRAYDEHLRQLDHGWRMEEQGSQQTFQSGLQEKSQEFQGKENEANRKLQEKELVERAKERAAQRDMAFNSSKQAHDDRVAGQEIQKEGQKIGAARDAAQNLNARVTTLMTEKAKMVEKVQGDASLFDPKAKEAKIADLSKGYDAQIAEADKKAQESANFYFKVAGIEVPKQEEATAKTDVATPAAVSPQQEQSAISWFTQNADPSISDAQIAATIKKNTGQDASPELVRKVRAALDSKKTEKSASIDTMNEFGISGKS